LSRQAHAFRLKPGIYKTGDLPKDADNYGYELWFEAKARGHSRRRTIDIAAHFQIHCGGDAVLLIFSFEHGSWREALRWQSAPYAAIDGAFDTLDFAVSPADRLGGWYVVATDIPPWCTSFWSKIRYAMLRPVPGTPTPGVIFSDSAPIYWGNEDYGTLTVRRNEFDLRFHGPSIDPVVHNRVWNRRYRVAGDSVRRIPPFALSPRDFVDEWAVSPWEQAVQWSSPGIAALKAIHRKLRDGHPFEYVSARKCSGLPLRYQVEMGQADDHVRYYFQLAAGPPQYRMAAIMEEPAAACNGRNILNSMTTR
ncbi:MAG TPA: hypothetical protein VFQ82_01235, partial [Stellaceae bacterium]|nr:hypothetical protein [Stellaceae bacterium]